MHLDILHFSLINTLPGDKKFQAAGGKVKVVAQALRVRGNSFEFNYNMKSFYNLSISYMKCFIRTC